MNITEQIENDFGTRYYKQFSEIIGTKLWYDIMKVTSDDTLMKYMIYANDELAVPPVKTFLYMADLEHEVFQYRIKQCMGAVFGFLFCELLGYSEKQQVHCGVANVKKAAKFIKK